MAALVDSVMADAESLYAGTIGGLEILFQGVAREAAEGAIRQAAVATGKTEAELTGALKTETDSVIRAAHDRASELLGMKRTPTGLEPDPSAVDDIMTTTRERVKAVLEAAGPGADTEELKEGLKAATEFSTGTRGEMIARTELGNIWGGVQFEIFTAAGVKWVDWVTTSGAPCPECLMNEVGSPVRLGERFPSGAYRPTIHPWCGCLLEPAEEPTEEE